MESHVNLINNNIFKIISLILFVLQLFNIFVEEHVDNEQPVLLNIKRRKLAARTYCRQEIIKSHQTTIKIHKQSSKK